MTTTFFIVSLMAISTFLYIISYVIAYGATDDKITSIFSATIITIFFLFSYSKLTPSTEQMIENDYYAMLSDKPKCIDSFDFSLGCKKDYIEWQKDSIEKQHKYDSVKIALDNKQKEILK